MNNHNLLSSQRLLELTSSYKITIALHAAMELDIFTELDQQHLTSEQLAKKLNADPVATGILLDFLAGYDLLERENDNYTDTAESSKFLSRSSPYRMDAFLKFEKNMMESATTEKRIVERVKKGFQRRPEPVNAPEANVDYANAMTQGGAFLAMLIARTVQINRFNRILDLGGGPGNFAITFRRLNPEAEIFLFDTPDITPHAERNIAEAGFTDGIRVIRGDFMKDPLGDNYDCILMSNILHFYPLSDIRTLLQKAQRCLRRGGTLLIHDFFLEDDRKSPTLALLYTISWLAHGGLFNLTISDTRRLLEKEKYQDIEYFNWPEIPTSLFQAKKR